MAKYDRYSQNANHGPTYALLMLNVNLRHRCDKHKVDFHDYDELKEYLDVILFNWREWVLITKQSHYWERHENNKKDWVYGLFAKEECGEDN